MDEDQIKNSIRKEIAYYRKAQNLSQEALGELLNVKKTTVSSWEVGKSLPDICTLYKMSKIFHVSLDTMFGDALVEQEEDYVEQAYSAARRLSEYYRRLKELKESNETEQQKED